MEIISTVARLNRHQQGKQMHKHIARLRADVLRFVRGKSNVTLDEIIEYVNSRGRRIEVGDMFADWLAKQGIEVDRGTNQ